MKRNINEIEKFCRFIDLTHKIFCMIKFRVTKKLISSENGIIRASEMRQIKTEFNKDCKKYLRMDRASEDILPYNYFYRLDEAREILAQEEFANVINWDLNSILSGKNKKQFLKFLSKGSSQLFNDLLPILFI